MERIPIERKKGNLYVIFYDDKSCDLSSLVCQNLHEKKIESSVKYKKSNKVSQQVFDKV